MLEALRLAEKLASMDAQALRATKRLFHDSADLPLEEALERGRETNKRMRGFRKA
jgi:enoyl-CoA hydratase/carnithine racemase